MKFFSLLQINSGGCGLMLQISLGERMDILTHFSAGGEVGGGGGGGGAAFIQSSISEWWQASVKSGWCTEAAGIRDLTRMASVELEIQSTAFRERRIRRKKEKWHNLYFLSGTCTQTPFVSPIPLPFIRLFLEQLHPSWGNSASHSPSQEAGDMLVLLRARLPRPDVILICWSSITWRCLDEPAFWRRTHSSRCFFYVLVWWPAIAPLIRSSLVNAFVFSQHFCSTKIIIAVLVLLKYHLLFSLSSSIRLAIFYIYCYFEQIPWKDPKTSRPQNQQCAGPSLGAPWLLRPVCGSQPEHDWCPLRMATF